MNLSLEAIPNGKCNLYNYGVLLHTYDTESEAQAAFDLLTSEQTMLPDKFVHLTDKLIRPLYPQEGGPCLGFSCGACGGVTKTQKGIHSHLWSKHRISLQMELFNEITK